MSPVPSVSHMNSTPEKQPVQLSVCTIHCSTTSLTYIATKPMVSECCTGCVDGVTGVQQSVTLFER